MKCLYYVFKKFPVDGICIKIINPASTNVSINFKKELLFLVCANVEYS
jgi:hypothetical protein